jgi:hypothetical protein
MQITFCVFSVVCGYLLNKYCNYSVKLVSFFI